MKIVAYQKNQLFIKECLFIMKFATKKIVICNFLKMSFDQPI